jgi:RNA polymerase sigma-70 factor (ECF subfamily)
MQLFGKRLFGNKGFLLLQCLIFEWVKKIVPVKMEIPRTEREQIRLMAKGDEQAFEQLFRSWYARLVVYACNYLTDRQEAENIVQMVFIKLWEKHRELKIESLKGYLTAAVRNGCINELKRHRYHLSMDEQFNIEAPGDEDNAFEDDLIDRLSLAIGEMPPQRQKIFKMGRFEGLKYKEIAALLGISPKTVEVHMGKALKTLRDTFNPGRKVKAPNNQ